ncbi:MAG: NAD(P)H-dependent oxidoreductase [Cytophagaceae bacterium]|nr:MAG: NAD(P)H-dependent oxidoreductase [Cytophagaceae bacterium]
MSLQHDLTWRYATKKMNGRPVPEQDIEYIVEMSRLAPSSSGLQPYHVFVITDRELLAKIRAIAFDQSQVTDCSHLLVFAAWDGYSPERIGAVLKRANRERGLPEEKSADYQNMLWSMYEPRGTDWQANHAARQAYIAFGIAIAAAAERRVDATPMEGFDNAQLDALLNLTEQGLTSVTLLPLGYRDTQNDWLVDLKKVRMPTEQFVTRLA